VQYKNVVKENSGIDVIHTLKEAYRAELAEELLKLIKKD
jgi:hypothetical protein